MEVCIEGEQKINEKYINGIVHSALGRFMFLIRYKNSFRVMEIQQDFFPIDAFVCAAEPVWISV